MTCRRNKQEEQAENSEKQLPSLKNSPFLTVKPQLAEKNAGRNQRR